MAHGRRLELKSIFIEIIDLCLYGFAHPVNTSKGETTLLSARFATR